MNNVELMRELFRVMHEEGLSGLLSRYDDFYTGDFEWRPPITEMTGAPYIGREGYAQYVADVRETLGDLRGELEEVTEIAPDVVRCRLLLHGEGTSSGAAVDAPLILIARLRDGRASWSWASYDLAAADRVAGAMARGEEVEV